MHRSEAERVGTRKVPLATHLGGPEGQHRAWWYTGSMLTWAMKWRLPQQSRNITRRPTTVSCCQTEGVNWLIVCLSELQKIYIHVVDYVRMRVYQCISMAGHQHGRPSARMSTTASHALQRLAVRILTVYLYNMSNRTAIAFAERSPTV